MRYPAIGGVESDYLFERDNRDSLAVLLSGIVLLIPALQLGLSYYVSVQVLAFLLAAAVVPLPLYIGSLMSRGALLLALPVFLSPILQPVDDVARAYLWCGRIYLCFLVFYTAADLNWRPRVNWSYVSASIAVVTSTIVIFAVLQRLALAGGYTLYLPKEWYITNEENLATDLDVQYGFSRASASFGEPSYLAFVIFSLYFVVRCISPKGQIRTALVLALWVGVIVSGSLAGLVSFLLLALLLASKDRQLSVIRAVVGLLVIGVVGLAVEFWTAAGSQFFERLQSIIQSDFDQSTEGRLIVATRLALDGVSAYPLGAQLSVLEREFGMGAVYGADNGFLLFIANLGIGAILIYAAIAASLRGRVEIMAYLLCASMFNGSVFSYDKVAVAVLALVAWKSSRYAQDVDSSEERKGA